MNEEQRLANQQVNQPKKEDKPEKEIVLSTFVLMAAK